MNGTNWLKSPVFTATATVTAGFRWAAGLPQAIAVTTPQKTAKPQPAAMTIHPAASALDCFSGDGGVDAFAHEDDDESSHELSKEWCQHGFFLFNDVTLT
jgi:hypothetical protein